MNEASFTLANGQTWSQNAASTRNNPGTNVQVAAVVSGGKLTSVSLIHPTTSEVNANNSPYVLQCGPNFDTPCATILAQAAVTAQSANISVVSGSTFYSEAYKASLQNALTQAGL